MEPRALRVFLVIPDRAALRHCSRLTSAFGYQVQGTTSVAGAGDLIAAARPDIVLVDATGGWQPAVDLCRLVGAHAQPAFVYKALLVGQPKHAQLIEAIEAGVDDFLASPIEHGELLARLRTAARVLEFERRLAGQCGQGRGGLSQSALVARLDAELRGQQAVACVMVEVDHARELEVLHGQSAAAEIAAQIGRLIGESSPPPSYARLDRFRLGVVVAGDARQAARWAEGLRRQVAEGILTGGTAIPVTVSCGISDPAAGPATAAALVERSQRALQEAQRSGGDLVVACDQFADEDRRWADFAAQGTLFENTLARDIMVPCAGCLHVADSLSKARALFRQTQLRALPVVDDEGKLAGLLSASSVQQRPAQRDGGEGQVSRQMKSDVVSFDERTTLPALIDYFLQESPLLIVVVNKGRPTGLVTPSSLATLSEQITTETFAANGDAEGTAALVVPNLCGADTA